MFNDIGLDYVGEVGGRHVINAEHLTGGMEWDPGLRRPYRDDRGQIWVDVTVGRKARTDKDGNIVRNALGHEVWDRVVRPERVIDRMAKGLPVFNVNNAFTLRKDQWILLDNAVLTAFRTRLRAWADLRAAATFGGFDGMATPILEYEAVMDIGSAGKDMEGLTEGKNFQPSFELRGQPLPITHSDFWLSERFLAISRTKGQPADTIRGEMAGRRVGELVEDTVIGNVAGVLYGDKTRYTNAAGTTQDSKVYGYTNHPDRITYTTLTASASVTPEGLFNHIIAMREAAYAQGVYGPFMVYVSTPYDAKLDNLFKLDTSNYPTIGTTRQAIKTIDGIIDVRRLDRLSGDVILMVQMGGGMIQAINGLELTTVQWDTKGSMQHNFKVMCIQEPRIRSAFKQQSTTRVAPIVHGTTS
jgi:hypothetical protein